VDIVESLHGYLLFSGRAVGDDGAPIANSVLFAKFGNAPAPGWEREPGTRVVHTSDDGSFKLALPKSYVDSGSPEPQFPDVQPRDADLIVVDLACAGSPGEPMNRTCVTRYKQSFFDDAQTKATQLGTVVLSSQTLIAHGLVGLYGSFWSTKLVEMSEPRVGLLHCTWTRADPAADATIQWSRVEKCRRHDRRVRIVRATRRCATGRHARSLPAWTGCAR
jgi:hypothetical protein